ncbi:proliferating cell nuclear antigen [Steccherinum ochraceum]|uniref:DNA sliding clamp PCNA n=1 Tax=Steccherinum ochraceum TaxID=92696 RepID=A0A4R0RTY3_9APHY|nr:proliferating cell nuclear antigen [Steccherinum ochraceum]
MLEAKLAEAAILKRLLDAIKELVADANFECNEEGIHLQAMDNSHVALVSVQLAESGFKKYRCDRPMPLGVNLNSLTKVLKCAKDDDICILKAADDADLLSLTYEARNSDRIAEYDMKLMDIDSDKLGIPDTDYDARVTMPSSEFGRIVRDLSQLGESVRIEVSKEGVRFFTEGEAANGNILLKQSEAVGKVTSAGSSSKTKKEEDADEDEEEGGDEEEEDEDGGKKKKKDKKKVKKEGGEEDVEMNGDDDEDGEFKADEDEDGEEEVDSEESSSKKRKRAPAKEKKSTKKAKKGGDDDELPEGIRIEMNQHVNLTFSLKYLVNFAKSSSLSSVVQLMLSNDVPLLVSYEFGQGHIRYYLAPKIGDE